MTSGKNREQRKTNNLSLKFDIVFPLVLLTWAGTGTGKGTRKSVFTILIWTGKKRQATLIIKHLYDWWYN